MGGVSIDEKTWSDIIKQVDTNGDGKFSRSEFVQLMQMFADEEVKSLKQFWIKYNIKLTEYKILPFYIYL